MKAWLSATVIPMGAGIIAFLALGWWQAASDREHMRAFIIAHLALMAVVAGIAGWRAVRLGCTRWAGAFAGAGAMGGVLAGFTAIHVGVTGRLRCHGIAAHHSRAGSCTWPWPCSWAGSEAESPAAGHEPAQASPPPLVGFPTSR